MCIYTIVDIHHTYNVYIHIHIIAQLSKFRDMVLFLIYISGDSFYMKIFSTDYYFKMVVRFVCHSLILVLLNWIFFLYNRKLFLEESFVENLRTLLINKRSIIYYFSLLSN